MATDTDLAHDETMIEAMESTCNDLHGCEPCQKALPELSGISSIASMQGEVTDNPEQQQLRVYLRVRPFSKEELNSGEDQVLDEHFLRLMRRCQQGCIVLEDSETAALHAPKGSASMKCSEKGIGQSKYKFSFTQIFGPEVGQAEVFDGTVRSQVLDFLLGKNSLLFSYGVTNAGKTHTIQGSSKDPGILPRALDIIFRYMGGRQYAVMDLKPYLGSDVQRLDAEQLKTEKLSKAALLKEADGEQRASRSRSSSSSSASSLSFSGISYDPTESAAEDCFQYCVWVSFYEIYNEQVFDLLQSQTSWKTKKRPSLRVCDDSNGNSYVRDLRWVNIHNADEASKVLRVGNKNRSAASTKMNQSSSRSHSIFTIKLLRIDGSDIQGMSELSLCDLAGSERCNKTKTFGERLKEAGNINTSLLILGKCIAALRNNSNGVRSSYVPYRESKLTRLFQGVFSGRGKASMIVNINQCASTYDETLNVMKFSAVAQKVVQVLLPHAFESRLVGRDGKPLLKNGVIDQQAVDEYLSEDELLDGDDEADMSILPQEELLGIIESLRSKLLAERKKNLVQEIQIRKEMGDAMLKELMECEEQHSQQIEELKESYEEKLESTFDMYKDALKEHAYQRAMERVEEDYIPIEDYNTAQHREMELKSRLSEVEEKLRRSESSSLSMAFCLPSVQECSTQTHEEKLQDSDAERCKRLYKEKCAVEKLCCEKQELIVTLESRISDLNDTLQEAGESYMEKLALVQTLQNRLAYQERETERLQCGVTEKEAELSSLREELAKLSQPPQAEPSRSKRGLLANIKESVSSPRSAGTLCRTLKRSVKSTASLKKKPV